ncbi:MAG: hypothetical protein SOI57_00100 [Leuconostoc gelidum]|jgi:hypothetical protein|uniref:hypothetical protein n=1 Tax=Leuconostoc gelidum TaxID=1244 RepID=UPI002F356585
MSFTRGLLNQSVPPGKYFALDSSVSGLTRYLVDKREAITTFEEQKYNLSKAKSVLKQYRDR